MGHKTSLFVKFTYLSPHKNRRSFVDFAYDIFCVKMLQYKHREFVFRRAVCLALAIG